MCAFTGEDITCEVQVTVCVRLALVCVYAKDSIRHQACLEMEHYRHYISNA